MSILTYGATFLATSLYAVLLERLHKAYEPRWTWATVVVGVSVVLLGVLARIELLPLPELPPIALARWVWCLVGGHFVAGGAPIVIWQVWQERRMLLDALNYRSRGK